MKSLEGRPAHGESSPNGLSATTTSAGYAACSARGAHVGSSATALPADHTTTSARAASSRANAASPTTLSLDAHRKRNSAPSSPSGSGAPHSTTRRSGSPRGVLDLHHVGAAVGQQLGAVRAGQPARQVDDLHAGERPARSCPATVGQAHPTGWCLPPSGTRGSVVGSGRAGWDAPMTAAWMWARAELRARWKAWLLLGILAGVTVGVAAAGWAGARRTERAVPDAVIAARTPTAAVLANDPAFGPEQRAEVAQAARRHRDLSRSWSASRPQVFSPAKLGSESPSLFPTEAAVHPDPDRPARRRAAARSEPGRRDRGRREHPRPVRARPRLHDGARAGGAAPGRDPAAVRTSRRRDQLPRTHEGRRHRQVGVERPGLDAVERLLREVRLAHARVDQPVRRPARWTRRHPRVQPSRSTASSVTP